MKAENRIYPAACFWIFLLLGLFFGSQARADFYVIPVGPKQYQGVVVVAKSGAKFTTVQSALDSITDASADKRYLVKIAPGSYRGRVVMKEYVDIEGSGQANTIIREMGSPSGADATVQGANNAELRDLTAESFILNPFAPSAYTVAVRISWHNTRLTNVTVKATGGTAASKGVEIEHGDPVLNGVTATVSGPGALSYGVHAHSLGKLVMTNCEVTASGSSTTAAVRLDNVDADLDGVMALGSGNGSGCGIRAYDHVYAILNRVATWNDPFSVSDYAIKANNYASLRVMNSSLIGTAKAVTSEANSNVRMANSLVSGTVEGNGITCVGNYDYDFAPLNTVCQ